MIRIDKICDALIHLVGWRQSISGENIDISENLTESESGLFFQDAHPLLTLQNLSCVAPDFKNFDYVEHTIEEEYKKYTIVTYNSIYYKAIQDVPKDIEIDNKDYWVQTNPFSEWLEYKTKASISKAILRYVNDKLNKGTYKQLFENRTLFDGTGRICDTVKNRKNLVGFEIVPIRSKGVTTKINKIGLQFTEPGEYEIFIFHSSNENPIYTFKFTKIKKNTLEWFKPEKDIYLPYESDENDAGGSWFICYFQSDLPENSQAIRKERDWSKGPCNSCSRREFEAWQTWSKYLEVHPFYVNEELIPFEEVEEEQEDNTIEDVETEEQEPTFIKKIQLWDIEKNQYIYDTNFGINLDLTVSCDITDFIIEQKALFADIISKQLAVDMLREFAFNANVRTNRHSINASRLDILYEIDGDSSSIKKSGLSFQLEQAYKAIEFSTEGIDRVCLPCINNGIKYRTV